MSGTDAKPSGNGTSASNDVADPHPADEEKASSMPHPGGANPPRNEEAKVSVDSHGGKAPKATKDQIKMGGVSRKA